MISPERFSELGTRYPQLRLAVVGDFCLDRYLEIDPARSEISIETGLPVHNVTRVRSQPGAAGTIVNNLAALGIGTIHALGFCGEDGEGWELQRALRAVPGVCLEDFLVTNERATFTYTKPLICADDLPPRELSRLDRKNWNATPLAVSEHLTRALAALAPELDGVIVMDQVSLAETGVITAPMTATLSAIAARFSDLLILADSRRARVDFAGFALKMNAAELAALTGTPAATLDEIRVQAQQLARGNGRAAIITLAERGMLGALPNGETVLIPAQPIRGPIDVVGAGDGVMANIAAALSAGASLEEALTVASAAASLIIHQLGTTGTASLAQIGALLASHCDA